MSGTVELSLQTEENMRRPHNTSGKLTRKHAHSTRTLRKLTKGRIENCNPRPARPPLSKDSPSCYATTTRLEDLKLKPRSIDGDRRSPVTQHSTLEAVNRIQEGGGLEQHEHDVLRRPYVKAPSEVDRGSGIGKRGWMRDEG